MRWLLRFQDVKQVACESKHSVDWLPLRARHRWNRVKHLEQQRERVEQEERWVGHWRAVIGHWSLVIWDGTLAVIVEWCIPDDVESDVAGVKNDQRPTINNQRSIARSVRSVVTASTATFRTFVRQSSRIDRYDRRAGRVLTVLSDWVEFHRHVVRGPIRYS